MQSVRGIPRFDPHRSIQNETLEWRHALPPALQRAKTSLRCYCLRLNLFAAPAARLSTKVGQRRRDVVRRCRR